MNARQTRALALLAGHGAVLLFAFGYYADLVQTLPAPPRMPPLTTLLFVTPALLPAIGVGMSYSALVASTSSDERGFKALERMSVWLFALVLVSSIVALFLSFSSLSPLATNH